jgi:hypothetical protein
LLCLPSEPSFPSLTGCISRPKHIGPGLSSWQNWEKCQEKGVYFLYNLC